MMRTNQFRAACPGIGWEREQRRPSSTIGGRSPRWQVVAVDAGAVLPEADEDLVIVRGTD